MKIIKVLILAYDFRPLNTVGAHRINDWADNLHGYGVKPIVVSRKWSNEIKDFTNYNQSEIGELEIDELENATIIRVPNHQSFIEKLHEFLTAKNLVALRKLVSLLSLILRFLPFFNIEKNIYNKHLSKIIKEYNPDLILASGEPFVLFKYAFYASKKYNIPYALDYRDGWSTDIFRLYGLQKYLVKFESIFERKYLKQAFFTTIVSDMLKDHISQMFSINNLEIIENGVDLDLVREIEEFPDPVFTIVYTGTIYFKHNVRAFLEAFEKFIHNAHAIVKFVGVNYYSQNENTILINAYAKKYPNNILVLDRLPKREAIQLQKNASILLKFSSGPVVKGFYGAKLYEYASINKPILNIVANQEHAQTDFFIKEKIQTFAWDLDTCYNCLVNWQQDFENGTLKRNYLNNNQLESISRKAQTQLLAKLIKSKCK